MNNVLPGGPLYLRLTRIFIQVSCEKNLYNEVFVDATNDMKFHGNDCHSYYDRATNKHYVSSDGVRFDLTQ